MCPENIGDSTPCFRLGSTQTIKRNGTEKCCIHVEGQIINTRTRGVANNWRSRNPSMPRATTIARRFRWPRLGAPLSRLPDPRHRVTSCSKTAWSTSTFSSTRSGCALCSPLTAGRRSPCGRARAPFRTTTRGPTFCKLRAAWYAMPTRAA